jgi:pyruvate/2-oxoglutarate/acetoin dehydrogenase E1 component
MTEAEANAIKAGVTKEADEALKFAAESPTPDPNDIYGDLFYEKSCAAPAIVKMPEGGKARILNYADAIREALSEEMERDETVFLMGESSHTFERPKAGLIEKFGTERVRYTPIAETAIIGTAMGAALTGMHPVAELIQIDFAPICMDQIVNQLAKVRYSTGGGSLKLPAVIRTQGGNNGPAYRHGPQHEQSLEALITHMPGIQVVIPSTPFDAKGLLKSCIRGNDPVLFIEHKLLYDETGPVPEGEYLLPVGKADVKRKGSDITIVSWSWNVGQSLRAAETLQKQGISIEVVDLRTLKPLDEETILNSVKKTGRLMIVHEACITSGFGAEIAAMVAQKGFHYLKAPIIRVASLDVPIPVSPILLAKIVPSEQSIVSAATQLMGKAKSAK